MLEWVDWAYDQVRVLVRTDRDYKELSQQHNDCVKKFEDVINRLSNEDAETILEYLNLSIDIQYQETRLAYEFGKQVGRSQRQVMLTEK